MAFLFRDPKFTLQYLFLSSAVLSSIAFLHGHLSNLAASYAVSIAKEEKSAGINHLVSVWRRYGSSLKYTLLFATYSPILLCITTILFICFNAKENTVLIIGGHIILLLSVVSYPLLVKATISVLSEFKQYSIGSTTETNDKILPKRAKEVNITDRTENTNNDVNDIKLDIQRLIIANDRNMLTLISVIQAAVLGYLVYIFTNKIMIDFDYEKWIAFLFTFWLLVLMWHEYAISLQVFSWTIRLRDAFIPFIYGIIEFFLIWALEQKQIYFWFFALSGFFFYSALALFNMYFSAKKEKQCQEALNLFAKFAHYDTFAAIFSAGLILLGGLISLHFKALAIIGFIYIFIVFIGYTIRAYKFTKKLHNEIKNTV